MDAYIHPHRTRRAAAWRRRLLWWALIAGVALPSTGLGRRHKAHKRHIKRYHMSVFNVNTKERVSNLWVIRVDPKNKNRQWVGKRARRRLTRFLRDWRTHKRHRVPERLFWYLYLVGQHFDAPIQIVSGYRSRERKGSRHRHGKAADIRIEGVDPKVLWDYCKRFDRVGLGWYPRSKFVHMDVRDKSAYWIDDSGPGEQAAYRKGVPQRRSRRHRRRGRAKKRGKKGKHKAAHRSRKRAVR